MRVSSTPPTPRVVLCLILFCSITCIVSVYVHFVCMLPENIANVHFSFVLCSIPPSGFQNYYTSKYTTEVYHNPSRHAALYVKPPSCMP